MNYDDSAPTTHNNATRIFGMQREREQESVLRTAWASYTLYDDELHDFFPFVFIGIWEEIIVIDATHKKKTKRQGSGEKNEQNRKRNEIPTIKKHTNRL